MLTLYKKNKNKNYKSQPTIDRHINIINRLPEEGQCLKTTETQKNGFLQAPSPPPRPGSCYLFFLLYLFFFSPENWRNDLFIFSSFKKLNLISQVLVEDNSFSKTLILNRPKQLNALSHQMVSYYSSFFHLHKILLFIIMIKMVGFPFARALPCLWEGS
jgi:hypothetical protein